MNQLSVHCVIIWSASSNGIFLFCRAKAHFYFEAEWFPVCTRLFLSDLTQLRLCVLTSLRGGVVEAHRTSGLRNNRKFHFLSKYEFVLVNFIQEILVLNTRLNIAIIISILLTFLFYFNHFLLVADLYLSSHPV